MSDALPTVDELMELVGLYVFEDARHGTPHPKTAAAYQALRAALSRVLEATAVARKEAEQMRDLDARRGGNESFRWTMPWEVPVVSVPKEGE